MTSEISCAMPSNGRRSDPAAVWPAPENSAGRRFSSGSGYSHPTCRSKMLNSKPGANCSETKIASCLRCGPSASWMSRTKPSADLADIRLADQRQLGAVGAHHGRAEAQADIDGVGEHGFARTGWCHEDIDHQRPLASAGRIIGPDAAVRPAEQHAAALPGRRRAVPWQHRQRVAQQGEGRVGGRRQRQTGRACSSRPPADRRRPWSPWRCPNPRCAGTAWTSGGAASRPPRPAPRWRSWRAAGR